MPRALSKFYNWRTSFWYRWLHRPIRMHVTIDNKVKQPRLTVVFLHGISATSETWLWQIPTVELARLRLSRLRESPRV